MLELSWDDVESRAHNVWVELLGMFKGNVRLYGVPRGGIFASLVVEQVTNAGRSHPTASQTTDPSKADVLVDDIIDSGKTREIWEKKYPEKPFLVLVDKQLEHIDDWVSFPWERAASEQGPEENIRRILEHIGENPDREGLRDTPARVVRSYNEIFEGYTYRSLDDIKKVLTVFEDDSCDEMVVLQDIDFVSFCEHHMMPFIGRAHLAYIPDGRLIGLSKLARIVDIFSKRLQVQERMTQQITETLQSLLQPKGVGCIVEAHHHCMGCRGVKKQNARMKTSSLTGEFRDPEVRAEFLSLIRN